MVRIGALDMLESVPAAQIWPLASPLLSDPSRGVRIRAASLLAAVPTANQPPADRERFERAAAEFIDAQRFNADRPESRSALGSFFAKRGRAADAEVEYKAALRLSPQYAPAAANLADLYRGLGREADGESVLRAALAASPQDAGLHHALGLTLVRLKRTDEALAELRRAAELDPSQARYAYVYAVALHSAGTRRRRYDGTQRESGAASERSRHSVGAHFIQSRKRKCRRSARICGALGSNRAAGSRISRAHRGAPAPDGKADRAIILREVVEQRSRRCSIAEGD